MVRKVLMPMEKIMAQLEMVKAQPRGPGVLLMEHFMPEVEAVGREWRTLATMVLHMVLGPEEPEAEELVELEKVMEQQMVQPTQEAEVAGMHGINMVQRVDQVLSC